MPLESCSGWPNMEELDVGGVGEWLIEKGFSSQVAKAFAGKLALV